MSAIATYTNYMKELVKGSNVRILDTRKTTPLFRLPEKWAVLIGGGVNHRFGLYDMVMLLPQIMYILAQKQGKRVLLDGVDGDVAVGQSRHYLDDLIRTGAWRTAVREARAIQTFHNNAETPFTYPAHQLLWQSSLRTFAPSQARALRRKLIHPIQAKQAVKNSILNPEFAHTVGLPMRLKRFADSHGVNMTWKTTSEKNKRLLLSPYIAVALERYDRVAAAYHIEPRHPFFDKRIVEFCLSLPWQQKTYRGWPKAILRRSMDNVLSEKVRWRKSYLDRLNPAFNTAVVQHQTGLFAKVFNNDLSQLATYINLPLIKQIYQRYQSEKDPIDGFTLWRVTSLALWLENYQFI